MERIDKLMSWGIVALCVALVGILFMSCASPEIYFAREQARETAYLKRIAADTLARPVQSQYSPGVLLNGWVPRYNNGYDGYWYNGVYYNNNIYGPRPIIRLNSNRYVVPYRKSIKRRIKTSRKHGNNTRNNRARGTSRVHKQPRKIKRNANTHINRRGSSTRINNKARSVNRPRNKSQKQ